MPNTALASQPNETLTYGQLLDRTFWQKRFPQLSIEKRDSTSSFTKPHQPLERITARMRKEGYFGDTDAIIARHATPLAKAAAECAAMGLPPVFTFLFDEPWECFHRLQPVLSHLLGHDYLLLPDFWTWHVDPSKGQSGWKPHRDKGHWSLAADGSPLSLTVWVPLSEANTLNSCMYIIPANQDPTYGTPQDSNFQAPTNAVRALPAKPGDYLCWNQAVYHWGSPSSEFATSPRISMALEFQRGDIQPFNQPLLYRAPYPNFNLRLQLIAKQILQYQHMYGFSQPLRDLATTILEQAGMNVAKV